jgi:hypothetical protein
MADVTGEARFARAAQESTAPRPKQPRPIVILGAGGIVQAAHLPAYAKAGFPVAAIADIVPGKAQRVAEEIPRSTAGGHVVRAFDSVEDAVRLAPPNAVFDVAVPASQFMGILPLLPEGAAVLMQKPMGETLEEAKKIRALCRKMRLTAAVNFQLRYAPNHLGASALAKAGLLGQLDLHAVGTLDVPGEGAAAGDSVPQYSLRRSHSIVAGKSARRLCEDSAESTVRNAGGDKDFDDSGLWGVDACSCDDESWP